MNASSTSFPPEGVGRHYAELFAGAAFILTSLAVLRIFDPSVPGMFPPCPFLTLTGLYCPGCGSLRAIHQLLHGNLGNALAFNPFAVLASPFLVYGGLSYAAFRIRGKYLPRIFLPAPWIWILCAAIVVFGIARNLPVHPFNLLAPGALLAGR